MNHTDLRIQNSEPGKPCLRTSIGPVAAGSSKENYTFETETQRHIEALGPVRQTKLFEDCRGIDTSFDFALKQLSTCLGWLYIL